MPEGPSITMSRLESVYCQKWIEIPLPILQKISRYAHIFFQKIKTNMDFFSCHVITSIWRATVPPIQSLNVSFAPSKAKFSRPWIRCTKMLPVWMIAANFASMQIIGEPAAAAESFLASCLMMIMGSMGSCELCFLFNKDDDRSSSVDNGPLFLALM